MMNNCMMMKKIKLLFLLVVAISVILSCSSIKNDFGNQPEIITKKSEAILKLIASSDFKQLSNYIDSKGGLGFSPYTENLGTLNVINFSKDKIIGFKGDNAIYTWGEYDGIGSPIKLTTSEYYKEFIYDIDYLSKAEMMYVDNKKLSESSSLKSLYLKYPNSVLVKFMYKGSENIGFKDFKILFIVYTKINNVWYLSAITHSESTV